MFSFWVFAEKNFNIHRRNNRFGAELGPHDVPFILYWARSFNSCSRRDLSKPESSVAETFTHTV